MLNYVRKPFFLWLESLGSRVAMDDHRRREILTCSSCGVSGQLVESTCMSGDRSRTCDEIV